MNKQYRHIVLVLCLFAFFVTYFARLAISPVLPLITDYYNVSNAEIGFALTGMWLAYGVAQFPSGILADRYGEKSIILIAIGGTAVMSLLLAFSPSFIVFVFFAVLLGGVAGLHYVVATTLLTHTYDDIGTAIGFHSLGGPLAGLIAPFASAWVGIRFGWQPAVALSFVVGLPVFVLFMKSIHPTDPRRPNQRMRDRFKVRSLIQLLLQPTIAFPLIIAIAGSYIVQGLMTFLPAFLIYYHSYSPTKASLVFSAFFIVRAGGQILLGRASDQYGRDFSVACSLFAGGIGLALFITKSNFLIVSIAVILTGVGSGFFTALDPRFIDNISNKNRGAEFGLVRTVYTVIGAAGSVGVGLSVDLFGWKIAFAILSGMFFSSFILIIANKIFRFGY